MKMVECRKLFCVVSRNIKCYFKNKFMFFISLITPLILLILFATFLRNVYIDAFKAILPTDIEISDRIIEGMAGAWLISSVLSVSAVTVAFSSNTIMVDDKLSGIISDFKVSPLKSTTLSVAYFISNYIVTFIISICVMVIGYIYLLAVGWYISIVNVFVTILNILCCVLFGTLLAVVIENFISSQGGLSAVSTLVTSMYGFICGAYMPLSQFSEGLRNILCILPGTYSVGILRNSYMSGYINELSSLGVPQAVLEEIKNNFDANLYLFGNQIPLWGMYTILLSTCAVLFAVYIAIVVVKGKKNN
jgi:multidrug/hemolysin transport system permease protein